jgi:putative phosphoesterase
MKIALLSDIHANVTALEAALAEADRLGATRLAVAGDLVGHGPRPHEVVRLLRARRISCLRGNIDNKTIELTCEAKDLAELVGKKKTGAVAWSAQRLRKADLAWLARLPAELEWNIAGCRILLTHGSPLSDVDYIFASLTPRGLAAKLEGRRRPDVLVCGHSHVPFVRRVAGVLVVNCGTVGRPFDGDPRGSFALLEVAGSEPPRARIVRFAYDVAAVAADVEALGAPFVSPDEYRRGMKLKG